MHLVAVKSRAHSSDAAITRDTSRVELLKAKFIAILLKVTCLSYFNPEDVDGGAFVPDYTRASRTKDSVLIEFHKIDVGSRSFISPGLGRLKLPSTCGCTVRSNSRNGQGPALVCRSCVCMTVVN